MGRKRARATSTALDGCAWSPDGCCVRGVYRNRVWRNVDGERCVECVEITWRSQEPSEARILATLRFQGHLKFPLRRSVGRFAIGMEMNEDMEASLIMLDAGNANVMRRIRMPQELRGVPCCEAAVDSSGTTCVLMQCNGSVWAWQENDQLTKDDNVEGKWSAVVNPKVQAKIDHDSFSRKSGIFMSTPVLGSCFALVQTTLEKKGIIVLERIIYDMDSKWIPINIVSRKISLDMDLTMNVDLSSQCFISRNGAWCVLVQRSSVVCWTTGQLNGDEENDVFVYEIDEKVIDATWRPQKSDDSNEENEVMHILTILLSNGQVLDISLGMKSSLVPIEVEASMKLKSQVVWLSTQMNPKLLAFEDSSPALLTIGSDDDMLPTLSSICFDKRWCIPPTDLDNFNILWRRHRIWLQVERLSLEEALHSYCESSSQKNRHGLLHILRLFLVQSCEDSVHDIVFTLLSIIHHQGLSVIAIDAASPAAATFLDLLVTRIVSIDCCDRTQFVAYLMSAPSAFPSRNARRVYFRHQLKCLYRRIYRDEDKKQDSVAALNAFLDIYLPAIMSLAHNVALMENNRFELAMQQCKRISVFLVDHNPKSLIEDVHHFKHIIARSRNYDEVYGEKLMVVIVSYSMMCTCLYIDDFVVNLPRLLVLMRSNGEFTPEKYFRKEFVIPLLRVLNTSDSESRQDAQSTEYSEEWSIKQAMQLAIDTQTAPLLFSFCVESGSPYTSECIQKMTEAYGLLSSKNISPNHGHLINDLEMSICEVYLGEMIAILQHLPLVREFQRSMLPESSLSAEEFVKSAWDIFLKDVYTGLQNDQKMNPAKTSAEWTFSSKEACWQYRMMHLKKSLIWHLQQHVNRAKRVNLDEMPKFLARIFLVEFLQDAHLKSDDTKLIQKFLLKSQDALACSTNSTSLNERLHFSTQGDIDYKRKHNKYLRQDAQQSNFRCEKLLRSLAAVMWSLWVRERCAYCLRFLELIKQADRDLINCDVPTKEVGSMAATCALQLNTIGLLIGKTDQISFVQTSLLEDAAKLCPGKAAAVLGWGFPTDKINARYLKRYKAIRQLLKCDMEATKSNDCEDLEEIENRCQFMQSHVKRKIRDVIATQQGNGMMINSFISSPKGSELKRRWAMEIDVLVDCCCTLEFQYLVWALIRKKFRGCEQSEVVVVKSDSNHPQQATQVCLRQAQVRPTPSLLTKDTGMSRDEILTLLRIQQQAFDTKVQSLLLSRRNEDPENDQKTQSPLNVDDTKSLAGSSQLVSKFRAITRELSPRHQSFPDLDAERRKEMNSNRMALQRGQSVQNVLKLLQLRKHTEEKMADPRQAVGHLFANAAIKATEKEATGPNRTDTIEMKSNAPSRMTKQSARPSVFSLRFEEDVNGAHLKLLRCGNGKAQAVKLRSKRFELPERVRSVAPKDEHQVNQNENRDVTTLRVASVQTDPARELVNTVKSVTWADASTNLSADKYSLELHDAFQSTHDDDLNEKLSTTDMLEKKLVSSTIATQRIISGSQSHKSTQIKTTAKSTTLPSASCAIHKLSTHIQLNDDGRKKYLKVVQSTASRLSTSSTIEILEDDGDVIEPEQQQLASSVVIGIDKSTKNEVDSASEQITSAARMLKYQAKYREQVALRKFPITEKKNGNAHAFAGLRDDMKRMKKRLYDLEHFADTIDDDFKDSHHKLLRMGESAERQTQGRVLETVDSVLRETSEFDSRPASSVLERKAASDMIAAKNLLAKIERLALAVDNDDTR